jgi:hypothetical protein
MAGLVPAIYVFACLKFLAADARHDRAMAVIFA